jgi:DNA-binding GntR family transcriptional regulator
MNLRARAETAGVADGSEVLPRLKRSVLSTDIYEHLRAFVLAGKLKPGMRIVEERLARQMGTSRAPLREALWMLRSDGLVTGSGRDTRVVALSADDIRELHLLRATLETLLFQSAARVISTGEIAGHERLLGQMQLAAAEGRRGQLSDLDYEFHRRLCRVSDLPRVYRVWRDQHVLFRLWLNVVAEAEDDPATIVAHHVTLLDAVKSRDPAVIARETTNHIYGISSAFATERSEWAKEHAILVGDPFGIASQQSTATTE